MNRPPTIVLTGGGSGGHITPLLSLAHELKSQEPDCQIVYIGHKGDQFDRLRQTAKDFDFVSFINGGKFRRYHGESLISHLFDFKTLALNIRDFFRAIGAIGAAYKILRKVKPDVIFSKGGFVVVPVGIAARFLRIPLVTHDSDTVPGLANRIVGRWAVINATGMPAKYYKYPRDRIRYVGVPLSSSDIKLVTPSEEQKIKKQLGVSGMVLLIAGGGNGSKKLNDLMVAISPHLCKAYPSLRIIHLTGLKHEQDVKNAYGYVLGRIERQKVKVLGFSSQFAELSAAADLILTRAGATALAEFAQLGKACIVMPSPFLAGGHQLKNAEELSAKDAAVVIDEDTSSDELLAVVNELLGNEPRRQQLAARLHTLAKPNAAKDLAKIILQTSKSREG